MSRYKSSPLWNTPTPSNGLYRATWGPVGLTTWLRPLGAQWGEPPGSHLSCKQWFDLSQLNVM